MAVKGNIRLAAILQKRMGKIKEAGFIPNAEIGTYRNKGLVLDSFPDNVIRNDELVLCSTLKGKLAQSAGKSIRVLVVWADETPVVVDQVEIVDES